MDSEYEIDLSDFDDDDKGIVDTTPAPQPAQRPKRRYTKSQKVLDNARKNLEKARQVRKDQTIQRGGFQKFEYEDSEDDYTDSESDFEEQPKKKAPVHTKQRGKLTAREMKLMEKLERIEGIMNKFTKAKSGGKKHVHKTVIVQPPPQYMHQKQSDPVVERMKRSLLNDMF